MEQMLIRVRSGLGRRFFGPIGDKVLSTFPALRHPWAPNILTGLRIISVVPIALCLWQGYLYWTLIIYVLAAISDMLDGWLARKLGVDGSPFGRLFDPIADGFFVGSVLIAWMLKVGSLLLTCMAVATLSINLLLWVVWRLIRPGSERNIYGQARMVVASIGVGFLILGLIVPEMQLVAIMLMGVIIFLAFTGFIKHTRAS